jgi:serine/threonine protein kinase
MKSAKTAAGPDATGADAAGPPRLAEETDDPRLVAAVQEYVAAVESGRRPNRLEFVARHPEISAELSACLQGFAFVNSAFANIDGPTGEVGADFEPLAARLLGDFRLLREIGRGGMGVVYEAIQLTLSRRVAVKILPMAAALDPRHLERFRNEAHAAAQLHHTNIVPVYAIGCERSVHFYAMQLINGPSLAAVIEDIRRAVSPQPASAEPSGGRPKPGGEAPSSKTSSVGGRRGLGDNGRDQATLDASDALLAGSTTARLTVADGLSMLHSGKRVAYFRAVAKLMLQAAEALAYAHRQGVVHRDIKPANLLLDVQGTLWITDFGLAQMYADTGLTRTGDLLGTLRYMSPEQASGRAVVLDQRTDIYSLGITLYELLTLERALPGTTREQLLEQINGADPRSPRSIDKKIPVELENIIGRATSKDAADRYPTADSLAQDLSRFLNDEPVLARPPSIWIKAAKWTRRHRTFAASAVIVLLVAFIAAVVSGVLVAREQSRTAAALIREQHRAKEANAERELAQRNFAQAREAVDFFTTTAINDLPPSPDPKLFQGRRRLLEASLDYYKSFLEQQPNDVLLDAQLTSAKAQVIAVLAELGAVDEFLRASFEIRLLGMRSVQEDLGLSRQQATDAGKLAARFAAAKPSTKPSPDMTSERIRQMVLRDAAERAAGIGEILAPAQSARLHQVSRQIRGLFAFSDFDISAAVSLTPRQNDVLRSACMTFDKMRHIDRGATWEVERAEMQAAVANFLSSLSPRQIEAWRALAGPAYDGEVPFIELWFTPLERRPDPDGATGLPNLDPNPKSSVP